MSKEEIIINNKKITVVNITPTYSSKEDEEKTKTQVEKQLYNIYKNY